MIDLDSLATELRSEQDRISKLLKAIGYAKTGRRKKRRMSAAMKRRLSRSMKKRWAMKKRAEKA